MSLLSLTPQAQPDIPLQDGPTRLCKPRTPQRRRGGPSSARCVSMHRLPRSRRPARAPETWHLELQQLLRLFRRQLPFLRRRHFAAASDPPLRHSPEVTLPAHTSTAAPRGAANGCLSAAAGTAGPHSGQNPSALGPVWRCPNPIGGGGRSRVSPAGARKVPKCAEHPSGVPADPRGVPKRAKAARVFPAGDEGAACCCGSGP